mgnify:CR=1 FL=1
MNKTILVTQPEYDYTTRYISTWAEKVVQYAKNKNNNVIVLKNDRANRDTLRNVTNKTKPTFIFLNGHGANNMVAGQDNKPMITDTDNLDFLKNKILYALSCQSAKNLGPYCVNNAVKTYIGYTEDFIFIIDRAKRTNPKRDNVAALFLDASNEIPISLIKGKTTKDAYNDSQNSFRKKIRSLLTSESTIDQTSTIRFLFWDMKHQVCLGDQDAKI